MSGLITEILDRFVWPFAILAAVLVLWFVIGALALKAILFLYGVMFQ
jgi:hypothetical protein